MDSKTLQKSAIGFRGLESLVSDISEDLAVLRRPGPVLGVPQAAGPARAPSSTQHGWLYWLFSPIRIALEILPPQVVVCGAIVFIVWVYGLFTGSDQKKQQNQAPYVPPASDYRRPTVQPASAQTSSFQSSELTPPSAPPSDPLEEKPRVGAGRYLSRSEVRYCMFEKERLGYMEPLLSTNWRINRFNRFVKDYNSRCSRFSYYEPDMDAVRSEISLRGEILQREASRKLRGLDE